MLTTEKEAKEKLCIGPVGCGIRQPLTGERFCAARRCMAWQKVDMDLGRCSFLADRKQEEH